MFTMPGQFSQLDIEISSIVKVKVTISKSIYDSNMAMCFGILVAMAILFPYYFIPGYVHNHVIVWCNPYAFSKLLSRDLKMKIYTQTQCHVRKYQLFI